MDMSDTDLTRDMFIDGLNSAEDMEERENTNGFTWLSGPTLAGRYIQDM
jgi:hypothetical protein